MKQKVQIFFLFFITLLLLPGFVWLLLTGKIVQAAQTAPIYDDALQAGWQNWSWNSSVDFTAANAPFNGSKDISASINAWGGVYIHSETGMNSSTADSFSFSLRADSPNPKLLVILYGSNNQPIGAQNQITAYGDMPTVGTWKTYTVTIPTTDTVKGFALQDVSGNSPTKISLDAIVLNLKTTNAVSPVSNPVSTMLYTDSLANGWQNWSWNSTIDFNNSSPVFSGNHSLAFTPQAGWAGLYLHTNTPLDTTGMATLQFSMYTTRPNQKFSLVLFDDYFNMLSTPIALEKYGLPNGGVWKTYVIPLADLGAVNKHITGFVLQESTGQSQPIVYLDDIGLQSTSSLVTPDARPLAVSVSPVPTGVPTVTASPSPSVRQKKFVTLPPGSNLPSGADCTSQVTRSSWEPRPENNQANHQLGTPLSAAIDGTTSEGNAKFQPRIDGNFTGTTDEIIQWGACKWGLDEDIVRAVAAQESWWRQSTLGDFNSANQPESYGLLQVRKTYHLGTFPLSQQSTPFNVDYALGWRRACIEGYFNWIPSSAKGDEWGCVGLWFSGKWYDGDPNIDHSGANWYIAKVKGYLAAKPWLQANF